MRPIPVLPRLARIPVDRGYQTELGQRDGGGLGDGGGIGEGPSGIRPDLTVPPRGDPASTRCCSSTRAPSGT
jgi:hypothetical protein